MFLILNTKTHILNVTTAQPERKDDYEYGHGLQSRQIHVRAHELGLFWTTTEPIPHKEYKRNCCCPQSK